MKIRTRLAATATAGTLAAVALTGCATGTPEEQAEALASDFATWAMVDIYGEGVDGLTDEQQQAAVVENPFDGVCEGELESATSQIWYVSGGTEISSVELAKSDGEGTYWIEVETLYPNGDESGQPMPVRIDTVDGDLCVGAAGESAKVVSE